MLSDELKEKITHLNIWKKNDERAPHKPLLILYALAELQRSGKVELPFSSIKNPFTKLLQDFGPQRKTYYPEEPFKRLITDGIWQTQHIPDSNVSGSYLIKHQATGGFTPEVVNLLQSQPQLIQEVAELLLFQHFPETLHEDIITAIGLDMTAVIGTVPATARKKVRSPEFRDKILKAYEFSCAVCGLSLRLTNTIIAVEAAHIKWFQDNGPDTEDNGLALCSLHHKLLDRGAYTVNLNRQLVVAETVNGPGLEEWLLRFHGKPIRQPVHPRYQPNDEYLSWHEVQVFRSPGRYI